MVSKKVLCFCFVLFCALNALYGMDIESGIDPTFEKIKSHLQFAAVGLLPVQAKAFHCRKYGYNGKLIHIVKHPDIIGTGFIIENAQPSMFWGYWYEDSCVPKNLIFIEDNNVKYEAEVKNGADTVPKILSSSLFFNGPKNMMTGNLAVMWEVVLHVTKRSSGDRYWDIPSEKKYYITRASLAEIQKQDNILDLDKGKVAVTLRPERSQ